MFGHAFDFGIDISRLLHCSLVKLSLNKPVPTWETKTYASCVEYVSSFGGATNDHIVCGVYCHCVYSVNAARAAEVVGAIYTLASGMQSLAGLGGESLDGCQCAPSKCFVADATTGGRHARIKCE